jgi:hypothetical protein
MVKPIAWALVRPDGEIIVQTVHKTRSEAIRAWTEIDQWPWWKRQGFHCARVRLSLV